MMPRLLICLSLLLIATTAFAGAQREERLAASVQANLQRAISDQAPVRLFFESPEDGDAWLLDMSARLAQKIPDPGVRFDFLRTVHYEAKRAGLDPQLVMGLIQVESAFHKYAVSSAGAMGFMQVMPFWVKLIGNSEHNLFHLRTNLRYGCTILRFYLDQENGDLYRALGRYNGSLGKPDYPYAVLARWQNWMYNPANHVAHDGATARLTTAPAR